MDSQPSDHRSTAPVSRDAGDTEPDGGDEKAPFQGAITAVVVALFVVSAVGIGLFVTNRGDSSAPEQLAFADDTNQAQGDNGDRTRPSYKTIDLEQVRPESNQESQSTLDADPAAPEAAPDRDAGPTTASVPVVATTDRVPVEGDSAPTGDTTVATTVPQTTVAPVTVTPVTVATTASPATVATTASPGTVVDTTPGVRGVAAVTGVAANDVLFARTGPGVEYNSAAELRPGNLAVIVTGTTSKKGNSVWAEIELVGKNLWVNSKYLTPTYQLPLNAVSSMSAITEAISQASPKALAPMLNGTEVEIGMYPNRATASIVATSDFAVAAPGPVRYWGTQDGSGIPVNGTIGERLTQLGSSSAFLNPEAVAIGPKSIGRGNTPNSIVGAFPNDLVVEFHNVGSDQLDGFDWQSLIFVLRRDGNRWTLVGLYEHSRTT